MRHLRSITLGIILLAFASLTSADQDVYICTGKYATKYHLVKNCRGLKNCKAATKKVKKSYAIKIERGLCGFED